MKSKWGLCTQLASDQLHNSASQCFPLPQHFSPRTQEKGCHQALRLYSPSQPVRQCLDKGGKASGRSLVQAIKGREIMRCWFGICHRPWVKQYLHSVREVGTVSEILRARFFSVQFNISLVLKHVFAILNMEELTDPQRQRFPGRPLAQMTFQWQRFDKPDHNAGTDG